MWSSPNNSDRLKWENSVYPLKMKKEGFFFNKAIKIYRSTDSVCFTTGRTGYFGWRNHPQDGMTCPRHCTSCCVRAWTYWGFLENRTILYEKSQLKKPLASLPEKTLLEASYLSSYGAKFVVVVSPWFDFFFSIIQVFKTSIDQD